MCKYFAEKLNDHEKLEGGVQITDKIPRSPVGKTFYRLLLDM